MVKLPMAFLLVEVPKVIAIGGVYWDIKNRKKLPKQKGHQHGSIKRLKVC
jgi:hypothetical protein